MSRVAEASIPFGNGSLSALWDEAPEHRAVVVVAHGAGNEKSHPFLDGIASALVEAGISVLRFNFPYMDAGRRAPDPPRTLIGAWRSALDVGGRRGGGVPVLASGKSLGGRMASVLAAEEGERFRGVALVFFGYPLHPPGKPGRTRDEHLTSVTAPMLFLQGTADPFARLDLLEGVVERLGDRATLHRVEGGDHSFRVRGARRGDREIGRDAGAVAARFVEEVR